MQKSKPTHERFDLCCDKFSFNYALFMLELHKKLTKIYLTIDISLHFRLRLTEDKKPNWQ